MEPEMGAGTGSRRRRGPPPECGADPSATQTPGPLRTALGLIMHPLNLLPLWNKKANTPTSVRLLHTHTAARSRKLRQDSVSTRNLQDPPLGCTQVGGGGRRFLQGQGCPRPLKAWPPGCWWSLPDGGRPRGGIGYGRTHPAG